MSKSDQNPAVIPTQKEKCSPSGSLSESIEQKYQGGEGRDENKKSHSYSLLIVKLLLDAEAFYIGYLFMFHQSQKSVVVTRSF